MLKEELTKKLTAKKQADWLKSVSIVEENMEFLKRRVREGLNYLADQGEVQGYLKDGDIFGGDAKWNDQTKGLAKDRLARWLTSEGLKVQTGKDLFVDGWEK